MDTEIASLMNYLSGVLLLVSFFVFQPGKQSFYSFLNRLCLRKIKQKEGDKADELYDKTIRFLSFKILI